jgi:hypothetical protein
LNIIGPRRSQSMPTEDLTSNTIMQKSLVQKLRSRYVKFNCQLCHEAYHHLGADKCKGLVRQPIHIL